ncbi:hypothetical protein L6452_37910 [Arctium lappa]|uniref:Uncharacterized protein n=1 Tax=Arctium lappa TaxID=4217 RepID=A0ACB8Y3L5_ARCLA|nr:hypothetical protein L6452_37910 [Arctium lappa]
MAFYVPSPNDSVVLKPSKDYSAIELARTDRPGLSSEVSVVLTDLVGNVVNAEIWTHNARAVDVVHVTDDKTRCAVEDPKRLSTIQKLLSNAKQELLSLSSLVHFLVIEERRQVMQVENLLKIKKEFGYKSLANKLDVQVESLIAEHERQQKAY